MNESKRYKCISVASMTYAQKATDILRKNGIDSYVTKQPEKNVYGCARCIKIRADRLDTALKLLRNGGVKMSGDVYDL